MPRLSCAESPKDLSMTNPERLLDQETEQVVVRKVITRLVPFLALLYAFNILDRTNVTIAALQMKQSLHFSDGVYGLGVGIFFIGYFVFEVPSNLIMEKVGARRWIARIMITWGAISASMMFIKSPLSFYAFRFLLGVAEAGFYPGIILYLTYFVPMTARAKVISRFLSVTALVGLIGAPLGGALLKMHGVMGLEGWQWLFLLEGLPSFFLGFGVLIWLPNMPANAKWLSREEVEWLEARHKLEEDNSLRVKHISPLVFLRDPRVVVICLIFIISSTGGNGIGAFVPQMLKTRAAGMWSDSFVATVTVIPGLVGALAMVLASGHSDRTGKRRQHIFAGYVLGGLAYLACSFFSQSAAITLAWLAVNSLGERIAASSYWALSTNLLGARAIAGGIAFINSVGNLGGFFGPVLMARIKGSDNGGYTLGLYFAMTCYIIAGSLAFLLRRVPTAPVEQEDSD